MTRAQMRKKAIAAIHQRGGLLVYPLNNRAEPLSVWSELFPRSKMRWDWDVTGDDRVGEIWTLREELSRSREVVYAKWFQSRATLFSPDIFVALLAYLRPQGAFSHESEQMLEVLRSDSPLSTKQLKAAVELEGRMLEPTYNRAIKPLWQHLWIVGFGEFQDSSFPSLGIGATEVLFEDLWQSALELTPEEGKRRLNEKWPETHPFWKYAVKLARSSAQSS